MIVINYINEVKRVCSEIERFEGFFKFALLSDSHLSNTGPETAEHIKAVDNILNFDCIVHCGNCLNGDNPRDISMEILQAEFEMYKSSVGCGIFLPVQGKNDGWRDERCLGQLTMNIMTDEVWDVQLGIIDRLDNICRPAGKPYYYVDFPDEAVRMVVLCSYFYDFDMEFGVFEKYQGLKVEQLKWMSNEAFNTDKTVFVFSSTLPKSRFETGVDQFIYKGKSTESTLAIFQKAKRAGADIAAWIAGGYTFDEAINIGGVNLITINEQLGTNRKISDCWDSVVLDKKSRKLHFIRFGAGENRTINY